ncbi:hypothetical protein PHK61_17495 [Actinomycetospora lutea]|uniref:hypothetical protein n=1 Tax=Actinomycetospora lutea TaxID=663604 RepID=UPI0023656332|nr:hypothetical protein [Actinomycetospora lutea]MDD7940221.1 hypothetical protein [Actinomycetospora lutea]
MTVRAPSAVPPGMPAHLWEAAKRDVRGVIPDWLRSAEENGAEAPAHIREVARRAAKAGAGLGMAIAVGTQVDAAASEPGATSATTTAAVAPVAHTTGDVPPGGEAPALAESFRVLDPQGVGDDWLTVEMYQDVVVNEGAGATYNVDAFQYLIISDDAGQHYVFKEHHHAAVPEPPASETDLLIHERGQVHVVENADGSFSVDTVSYDRSVNGISEPAPDSGLGDGAAPPDDAGTPGWTPPVGLAAPGTPVSGTPLPVDDGLDGRLPERSDHQPDHQPDVLDAPAGAPDHDLPGDTVPGPDPGLGDHDAGNDPPDASELAV